MFISVWNIIVLATAMQMKKPFWSFALRAFLNINNTIVTKTSKTNTQPTKPHSSPTMAYMKSVLISGRSEFCA